MFVLILWNTAYQCLRDERIEIVIQNIHSAVVYLHYHDSCHLNEHMKPRKNINVIYGEQLQPHERRILFYLSRSLSVTLP